uniref:rRNA biogenesis protein RRP36 n=1 Tax=Heligmosomoides polygyrus TaxID=6339 RepID=A0A183FEX1_HELPZ
LSMTFKMADESESDFEHEFHERDKKASHRGMDKPATSMEMAEDEEEEDGEEEDEFSLEMADLPLGKVREMKEKLGLKLFNKAYFGTKADDKDKERQKRQAALFQHRGQHRPKEISSKRPVSTFRPLYQNLSTGKKWDPRFDIRAGEFKERCFEDNYSFLDDLRRQEREVSILAMAVVKRSAIRRMDNREKTKAEKKLKQETYKELRQENIDRMMRGERPVFKTKAKVRLMHMEKKFDQLKKDNKLENYMKRRAKKEAHREVKKKPSFEHQYGYQ